MKNRIFFLLLLFSPAAMAQSMMPARLEQGLQQKLAEQQRSMSAPLTSISIEKAVDPDAYIMGPGDVLQIIPGEASTKIIEATVSPEGHLLIPEVGALHISGLALTEAKARIIAACASKFIGRNMSVHLLRVRSFRISVTGAVMNPGLVEVTAMSRASEAIVAAGGLFQPIKVESRSDQVHITTPLREETSLQTSRVKPEALLMVPAASKRNIVLRRANGNILSVDLLKFDQTGDLGANPYVLDGDVIQVPNEELEAGFLTISGALKNPGRFEYRPGDRLIDLLQMAQGFTIDADTSEIEVVRFKDESSRTESIRLSMDPATSGARDAALQYPLMADDRVFVRSWPKFHRGYNVSITGEVMYPGTYALREGITRLREIIQMAGGLTPEASLKNAVVQRRAQEDILDPEFERLKKMLVTDMTESERDYFKVKSRERVGIMGVDFVALFEKGDNSQDILLRDRDLIHVPAQEQTVKISGQVITPGLYPYEPGMTMKYYLNEAGGYNWNARKSRVRLIRSKTGEWAKPNDNTLVEVGDTIFVPEKPERDWWAMTKEMITIVVQLATIYLVIETTRN